MRCGVFQIRDRGGGDWSGSLRRGVRCRNGEVSGGEVPQGVSSVHMCNEKMEIHVPPNAVHLWTAPLRSLITVFAGRLQALLRSFCLGANPSLSTQRLADHPALRWYALYPLYPQICGRSQRSGAGR